MDTFGSKLRLLRQRQGKTQSQVADDIALMFPNARLSQGALSAMERQPKAPREDTLQILAHYFNIPILYFLPVGTHTRQNEVRAYIEALRFFTPSDPRRFTLHKPVSREEIKQAFHDLDADMDTD